MRHPNVLRYLNASQNRQQLCERWTIADLLIAKLAPKLSEQEFAEILKAVEAETDLLCGKGPKSLTAVQEYGISLLLKSERKSKAVSA